MRLANALCIFPCLASLLVTTPALVALASSLRVGLYHQVATLLSLKGGNVGTNVGVEVSRETRGLMGHSGKGGRDTWGHMVIFYLY